MSFPCLTRESLTTGEIIDRVCFANVAGSSPIMTGFFLSLPGLTGQSLLLAVYNAVGADYLCAGELFVAGGADTRLENLPLSLRAFVVHGF